MALRSFAMNVAAGLAVGVPGYLLWKRNQEKRIKEQPLAAVKTTGVATLGGPYTMVDHFGSPVTLASYRGTWQLMYFGFTNCPEVCPTQLDRMMTALKLVQKERPNLNFTSLFVCCDTGRDSVAACRSYCEDFGPQLIGLTGTPKQVEKITKTFKLFFTKPSKQDLISGDYIIDHSIATFFMDPEGKFIEYWGSAWTAEEIAQKIIKTADRYYLVRKPFD
eukprot:RCo007976